MPVIPMKLLLDNASKNNYAYGAFNVNTVAQAAAIIEVHDMFRSAVIIQGADLANAFMGGRSDFMNGTVEDKLQLGRMAQLQLMAQLTPQVSGRAPQPFADLAPAAQTRYIDAA